MSGWGTFEELRSTGSLVDVTLEAEGRGIAAHKVVLAATVPYFRAMFTADMLETDLDRIQIQVPSHSS